MGQFLSALSLLVLGSEFLVDGDGVLHFGSQEKGQKEIKRCILFLYSELNGKAWNSWTKEEADYP